MATGPPTITQLKEHFISTQTLLLASGVAPSAAFRAANQRSSEGLDPRQLDTVSQVLETLIQDHCRRIYAPQATRALAEQISDSYSAEADRKLKRDDDDNEGIGREVDLVDQKAIKALPATWYSEKDATEHPAEAKRYAELVDHLVQLDQQRQEMKAEVERIRRLKALVDPLKTGDSGEGVQENLITRDCSIEKELDKMRTLLVRVSGRVDNLPDAPVAGKQDEDIKPLSELRKRNIDDFLTDSKVFPTR